MTNQRRYCYIEVRPSDEKWPPVTAGQQRRQTISFRRSDGAEFVEIRKEIEGVGLVPIVNDVYGYSFVYHEYIPSISRFEFYSMDPGEFVILELPGVPASAQVYTGNLLDQYSGINFTPVLGRNSLNQLRTTPGNGSYYDAGGNRLYVRFEAPAGADFEGNDLAGALFVCLEGNCMEGENYRFRGLYAVDKQAAGNTGIRQAVSSDNSQFETVVDFGGSILGSTNGAWDFDLCDWNNDGYPDIAGFKKQNTGTNSLELHIMSGEADFQSFILQTGTGIGTLNPNDHTFLADYNQDGQEDLWIILHNNTGSGMTEVHVLDGNNLQNFLLHSSTALGLLPNTSDDFVVSDWDGDDLPDLWYIKKQGASGTTEVHILNNSTNFSTFSMNTGTALHPTTSTWSFEVGDYNRDGTADLVGINRSGGSGKTEVHILNGNTFFQSFLLHKASGLAPGTANHVYLYDNATPGSFLGYDKAGIRANNSPNETGPVQEPILFPNPFTSRLTIQLELKQKGDVSVRVFDISGKQLFRNSWSGLTKGLHEFSMEPGDLPAGLYLYEVRLDTGTFQGKLIKE